MPELHLYIALGAVLGFSLVLFAAAYLATSSLRKKFEHFERKSEKQAGMLNSGVLAMGQRVVELEQRIASLRKQQSDSAPDSDDYSYSRARTLLDRGLSADAVSATCGLSLSEVELMKLIRSPKSPELQHSVPQ